MKMTKTQVKFRLKRLNRDVDFLFLNQPDWSNISVKDVEAIHRITAKVMKRA